METVSTVFTFALNRLADIWNVCVSGNWGIFGTFLISFALLKKIGKVFNKLKVNS